MNIKTLVIANLEIGKGFDKLMGDQNTNNRQSCWSLHYVQDTMMPLNTTAGEGLADGYLKSIW